MAGVKREDGCQAMHMEQTSSFCPVCSLEVADSAAQSCCTWYLFRCSVYCLRHVSTYSMFDSEAVGSRHKIRNRVHVPRKAIIEGGVANEMMRRSNSIGSVVNAGSA